MIVLKKIKVDLKTAGQMRRSLRMMVDSEMKVREVGTFAVEVFQISFVEE